MRANASNTEPLELHRAVLQPMLQPGCFDLAVRFLQHGDESTLLSFLHQQGLAPLWAQALEKANTTSFSSEFFSSLHQARLQATGIYLIQTNQMENVRARPNDQQRIWFHLVGKHAVLQHELSFGPQCCGQRILIAEWSPKVFANQRDILRLKNDTIG